MNLKQIEKDIKDHADLVRQQGPTPFIVGPEHHNIDSSQLSPNAVKVVRALLSAGYKAYLVGGCVRDLLLDKNPKDFDVCTSATPQQVTRVFSNAKVIGRRFMIVHVHFGNSIIEVTTFRSYSQASDDARRRSASGMLVADNAYGTDELEDAQRRDFTINALYYEVDTGRILDFNSGLHDLLCGQLELIGDPAERYREDPVRIIRACRFAAKLGFTISPRTLGPIHEHLPLLANISNARMYEEINKLFLTGHGAKSFELALGLELMDCLFPVMGTLFANPMYQTFVMSSMSSSDLRTQQDKPNRTHFLYSVLLWGAFYQTILGSCHDLSGIDHPDERQRLIGIGLSIIRKENRIALIPELVAQEITELWYDSLVMIEIAARTELVESFYRKRNFRACYDFLILRCKLEPLLSYCVKTYTPYYELSQQHKKEHALERTERRARKTRHKKSKLRQKINETLNQYLELEFNDERHSGHKQEIMKKARAWRKEIGLE